MPCSANIRNLIGELDLDKLQEQIDLDYAFCSFVSSCLSYNSSLVTCYMHVTVILSEF